jgi:hypothetical protein
MALCEVGTTYFQSLDTMELRSWLVARGENSPIHQTKSDLLLRVAQVVRDQTAKSNFVSVKMRGQVRRVGSSVK